MIDATQNKENDGSNNFKVSDDNEFTPSKMSFVSDCEGAEDAVASPEEYMLGYVYESPSMVSP